MNLPLSAAKNQLAQVRMGAEALARRIGGVSDPSLLAALQESADHMSRILDGLRPGSSNRRPASQRGGL
jgi:hypothetical protein